MATEAKSRNPTLRRELREKARKARRDIRGAGGEDSGPTSQRRTVWLLGRRGQLQSPPSSVKMMKNKANGTGNCLVTEILRELPMETVFEITHWFEKGF